MYCHIAAGERVTVPELAEATGLPETSVEASADRLVKGLLVERSKGTLRIMSFAESLAKCQLTRSDTLPLVIEDGIIRVRKDEG